jgi:hypothetical protein
VRLKPMKKSTKSAVLAGAVTVAVLGSMASTCGGEDSPTPSRQKETDKVQSNYDKLVANQPAHSGPYSPTRATKNFWIDTWMHDPNKLAYVFIQNAQGDYGYYVFKGLPVTYCVSLLPPEQYHRYDMGEDGSAGLLLKAPSMDGSYSSNTNCNSYYGKDAVTGAFIEFSVGANQSYQLFDRPVNLPQYKSAKPMGPATIEAVKNKS